MFFFFDFVMILIFEVSVGDEKENDWEFGYGAGVTLSPTENLAMDVGYEMFDNTDIVTAGLRYTFK